jgi:anti-anti-sigma factor
MREREQRPTAERIAREDRGPVTRVQITIAGLIADEDIVAVGEALEGLLQEGRHRLVLDLGRVAFPSSAFLGRVLWVITRVRNVQGRIALCHLSEAVEKVLQPGNGSYRDRLGFFQDLEAATEWAAGVPGE